MSFFDKKEEVISIELTPYGRQLLSLGKLKPTYYAFFDDDIIYDQRYAFTSSAGTNKELDPDMTIEEHQNDIELRIKDTPRLKAQHVFSGIETNITGNYGVGSECGELGTFQLNQHGATTAHCIRQPGPERNYSMQLPIGTSGLNNSFAPSWNIDFLNGGIHSYENVITGSSFGNVPIPQLSGSCRFKTYITFVDEDGSLLENYLEDDYGFYDNALEMKDFSSYYDRSLIQIQPNYIFLDVEEKNTDFVKENFDIEVYKIHPGGQEEQLYFFDPESEETEFKTHHVEYYLDIFVDSEIDDVYYCKSVKAEKRKNILSDQHIPFRCPDEPGKPANIYIGSDFDEEPC